MCEIGSDFPIQHFWSHWITSVYHIMNTHQWGIQNCFVFYCFPIFFSQVNNCFLDLLVLPFFSMTVINQPKKPHTIVHCTVGKVGSKREAENKTAPLSIFCHLLPWDIIMHRQWRRKTIICQVLYSTINTVPNNSYSFWADLVHKWLFRGYDWHPWILIQNSMPSYHFNQFFMG